MIRKINFNKAPQEWAKDLDILSLNKRFPNNIQKVKKEWYSKYLRQRIFNKYKLEIFDSIANYMNSILPNKIENTFELFADIKKSKIGDNVNEER